MQTNLKKNIRSSCRVKWKKKCEIERLRNSNINSYFNLYEFSTSDKNVASKE